MTIDSRRNPIRSAVDSAIELVDEVLDALLDAERRLPPGGRIDPDAIMHLQRARGGLLRATRTQEDLEAELEFARARLSADVGMPSAHEAGAERQRLLELAGVVDGRYFDDGSPRD